MNSEPTPEMARDIVQNEVYRRETALRLAVDLSKHRGATDTNAKVVATANAFYKFLKGTP